MISDSSKPYSTVSISPKSTIYVANGSGRDSYIFSNNGGLCKKPINNLNIGSSTRFIRFVQHVCIA